MVSELPSRTLQLDYVVLLQVLSNLRGLLDCLCVESEEKRDLEAILKVSAPQIREILKLAEA